MIKQQLDYPILALGFRIFFALAGLFALLLIAVWASLFKGTLTLDNYYPGVYWHSHEMLLGYTVAVIAGFLLTAVKNWTGIETVKNAKLAALALLWLYGRILSFYSELVPDSLIAAVDFLFLPCLAWAIAKPLLQAKQIHNLFLVVLLLVMATGNALVHLEILGYLAKTAWLGLQLVVAIIVMMILVIAGRIFPFFTEKALKGVISIRNPLYDNLAILSAFVTFGLILFKVSGIWLNIAAVAAFFINAMRLVGWYVQRIWYVPLLWVLYVGYGWILVGFMMVALAALGWVNFTLALHAFTVGGIGVLTLGMMARVSLGHTGRVLKASNTIAIAFVLLNIAALFRVLMPAIVPNGYETFLLVSTYSWLAAFSLFCYIYTPVLTQPRIDGQEG